MAIRLGDCLQVMSRCMEADSVDAIVTDPPYGLEFMNKKWDKLGDVPRAKIRGVSARDLERAAEQDGLTARRRNKPEGYIAGAPMQEWYTAWAIEALRVLKSSHYLLAFGGTRTWHRLACALEDAGFEIRDTLCWLYGQGLPKGKACLKPAWEPIILARKPGPMRELGIEECRIATDENLNGGAYAKNASPRYDGTENWRYKRGEAGEYAAPAGRWPANLILSPESASMLDAQTGTLKSGKAPASGFVRNSDKTRNAYGKFAGNREEPTVLIGDSGGASRFFYVTKAPSKERWGYLSCNCETDKLGTWESEDQSQHDRTAATSLPRGICEATSEVGCDSSTSLSGKKPTEKSQQDTACITSTETNKTTDLRTSNLRPLPNTSGCTPAASYAKASGGSRVIDVANASRLIATTGTCPLRDGLSMAVVGLVTSLRSFATSNCEGCARSHNLTSHPTQKPVSLMRWLVRLVAREGEIVLDPFMGSGTTGIACVLEGRKFLGIDREPEYIEISQKRIAHARSEKETSP